MPRSRRIRPLASRRRGALAAAVALTAAGAAVAAAPHAAPAGAAVAAAGTAASQPGPVAARAAELANARTTKQRCGPASIRPAADREPHQGDDGAGRGAGRRPEPPDQDHQGRRGVPWLLHSGGRAARRRRAHRPGAAERDAAAVRRGRRAGAGGQLRTRRARLRAQDERHGQAAAPGRHPFHQLRRRAVVGRVHAARPAAARGGRDEAGRLPRGGRPGAATGSRRAGTGTATTGRTRTCCSAGTRASSASRPAGPRPPGNACCSKPPAAARR